jgi:hypothetical protein
MARGLPHGGARAASERTRRGSTSAFAIIAAAAPPARRRSGTLRTVRALFLAFLVTAIPAHALGQPRRPTSRQWSEAETLVQSHLTAVGRIPIDVRRTERRLGTLFSARWTSSDGTVGSGLVAVRGGGIIEGRGEEPLRALLRADRFLETRGRAYSPADLLYLVRSFGMRLPFSTDPIEEHAVAALRPRIERDARGLHLVVHTHREGPPEDPAFAEYFVTRATLTIDPSYAFSWTTEDVTLDARGREVRPE